MKQKTNLLLLVLLTLIAMPVFAQDEGGIDPTADKGFAMCFDYGHIFGKESIHTDNFSIDFGSNVIPGLFVGAGPLAYIGGYKHFFYGIGGCADVRYTAPFWKYRPYVDFRYEYAYDLEYKEGGSGWCYGFGVCLSKKYLLGIKFRTKSVEYTDKEYSTATQQSSFGNYTMRKTVSKDVTKTKNETSVMFHFGWMF